MLRRNSKLAFAGGAWVFPGGRIDPEDYPGGEVSPTTPMRSSRRPATRRRARRWRRPGSSSTRTGSCGSRTGHRGAIAAPRRFATWFFVGARPRGCGGVDDGEIHEHQWIRPADAIAPARRGRDRAHPAHLDHAAHARRARRARSTTCSRARRRASPRSTSPTSRRVDGGIVSIWQGDAGYDDLDTEKPGPRQPPPHARRRLAVRDQRLSRTRAATRLRQHLAGARVPGRRRVVSLPCRPLLPTAPTSVGPTSRRRSLTGLALVAVACSGGGDDSGQAATTTAPGTSAPGPPPRPPPRPTAPKKIDTIPGMPGVHRPDQPLQRRPRPTS